MTEQENKERKRRNWGGKKKKGEEKKKRLQFTRPALKMIARGYLPVLPGMQTPPRNGTHCVLCALAFATPRKDSENCCD